MYAQALKNLVGSAGRIDLDPLALEDRAREERAGLVVVNDQNQRGRLHATTGGLFKAATSLASRSTSPIDPRSTMVATWPLSCPTSASVRSLAVRTMMGIAFVASSLPRASPTSKPSRSGMPRPTTTTSRFRHRPTP